tara:strand:+ start:770 stop:1822 length:1053 start_codon:yes stop_codon:yes gene_type:complete
MPYSPVNKGTDFFRTKQYAGNGGSQSITFDESSNFTPDFSWFKARSTTHSWAQIDRVRGVRKVISSDGTSTEYTETAALASWDSNGFTFDGAGYYDVNFSGQTLNSYHWKLGGAASANSDGTLATQVSANTTSGVSVATYTGTGSGGVTIGHGLGVKPKLCIIRRRNGSGENFQTWVDSTGDGTSNRRLLLNGVASDYNNNHITFGTSTITLPSSSDNGWSENSSNYVAWIFAEKTGFSAIKEYTGNGSVDGTFIYLGFKPAWAMVKQVTNDDRNWYVYDNKTSYNGSNKYLAVNDNSEEGTLEWLDFLSNGIKIRNTSVGANKSGQAYLVVAFAEAPAVGSNNVPCTAR